MTPEEQSYIDNVADTMDQETAKVYLEYEALKVKLRDDVKVIGHRAKYKAIWLGIMILSIPLWGYVIAQYWNWFVSLAGFHTITWLQGYCLVFAFQMLRTNFGRIELNDPCANYLHKMVDGDFTDADTTVLHYLGFDTSRAPFNSAELRRAVSQGIDRAGCVSSFLMGHGTVTQLPVSPASPLYPKSLDTVYSPDSFTSAVTAAGFGSGSEPVSVTLLVNSENAHKQSAAAKIAAALSTSALRVTVEAVPWSDFVSRLKSGRFDLYYGEYKMTADWDLTDLLSASGANNYGRFNDANFAALLTAERSATGDGHTDASAKLYEAFCRQTPIAPICFARSSILTTSGAIEGLTPSLTDPFYNLQDWTIHFS